MIKTKLTKIFSLILAICIMCGCTISASAQEVQEKTTRASEEHPYLTSAMCDVTRVAPFKLQIYVETNATEVVDEVGYTSLQLLQYDAENDEWITYGSWVSLHNSNAQTYSKTSYKYVLRGMHYKVVATHYAKKYGTLIDEIDEITTESAMIYVPTEEEDDIIWDTEM